MFDTLKANLEHATSVVPWPVLLAAFLAGVAFTAWWWSRGYFRFPDMTLYSQSQSTSESVPTEAERGDLPKRDDTPEPGAG